MLTQEQRSSWAERGFIRLDGFTSPDVCVAMLDRVLEIVRDRTLAESIGATLVPDRSKVGVAVAPPEDVLWKVFKLHRETVFAEFAHSDAVAHVIANLIGPDVDVFLSQFIFKTAGTRGQPWHQDALYFAFEPARPVVGLWLAVTQATLVNGCLHVLPGSQTKPLQIHVPERRPGAHHGYFEISEIGHQASVSEPLEMSPGDLLVFDSHLIHCSTDNESSGMRAAMVFHYATAGTIDHTDEFFAFTYDWVPALRGGLPTASHVA